MAKRTRERLSGRTAHEVVKPGSMYEHTAVVLHTSAGDRLILQRIGANPFDDEETHALAGHEVVVEGYRLDDIFRFDKAERSAKA